MTVKCDFYEQLYEPSACLKLKENLKNFIFVENVVMGGILGAKAC